MIMLDDYEVPMFNLSRGVATDLAFAAHSEWTHLGDAKNCDICKLAKMRESTHFAVDHEKAEEKFQEQEKYFDKIFILLHFYDI